MQHVNTCPQSQGRLSGSREPRAYMVCHSLTLLGAFLCCLAVACVRNKLKCNYSLLRKHATARLLLPDPLKQTESTAISEVASQEPTSALLRQLHRVRMHERCFVLGQESKAFASCNQHHLFLGVLVGLLRDVCQAS